MSDKLQFVVFWFLLALGSAEFSTNSRLPFCRLAGRTWGVCYTMARTTGAGATSRSASKH